MEYLLSQYLEPDFCVRYLYVVDLVVDLTLTISVGNF